MNSINPIEEIIFSYESPSYPFNSAVLLRTTSSIDIELLKEHVNTEIKQFEHLFFSVYEDDGKIKRERIKNKRIQFKQVSKVEDFYEDITKNIDLKNDLGIHFRYLTNNEYTYIYFLSHHYLLDGTSQGYLFDYLLSSFFKPDLSFKLNRTSDILSQLKEKLSYFKAIRQLLKQAKSLKKTALNLSEKNLDSYALSFDQIKLNEVEFDVFKKRGNSKKLSPFKFLSFQIYRAFKELSFEEKAENIIFAIPVDLRLTLRNPKYFGNMVAISRAIFSKEESLTSFISKLDQAISSKKRKEQLEAILSTSKLISLKKLKELNKRTTLWQGKQTSTAVISYMNMKNTTASKYLEDCHFTPLTATSKIPGISINIVEEEKVLNICFSYVTGQISADRFLKLKELIKNYCLCTN